jgi:hypothetical protein
LLILYRAIGVSLPTKLERGIDLLIDAAAEYGVGIILVIVDGTADRYNSTLGTST